VSANDPTPPEAPADTVSLPLERGFRGYSRRSVDAIVDELTRRLASAEQRAMEAERQNAELHAERERGFAELDRYRQIERSLTQTLSLAEESAQTTQRRAEQEAEELLAKARADADLLVRQAEMDRDRIAGEIDRIRQQLAQAVAALGVPTGPEPAPVEAAPSFDE
jgi:cell division initiation protein